MFAEDLSVGQVPYQIMVIMRVQISKLTECQDTIFLQQQNQNSTQSINTTVKFLIIFNKVRIYGKMKVKILVKILQFVNKIILSVLTITVIVQPKGNLIYEIQQFIRITMIMPKKKLKSQ